jgi:hypothetical protein
MQQHRLSLIPVQGIDDHKKFELAGFATSIGAPYSLQNGLDRVASHSLASPAARRARRLSPSAAWSRLGASIPGACHARGDGTAPRFRAGRGAIVHVRLCDRRRLERRGNPIACSGSQPRCCARPETRVRQHSGNAHFIGLERAPEAFTSFSQLRCLLALTCPER